MSNPTLGRVEFAAGGTTRALQFTTNALCLLEDHIGPGGIVSMQTLLTDNPSIKVIRMIFWAGLRESDPLIDEEGAGRIIDQIGMVRAGELLARALTAAFGTIASATGPLATATGAAAAPTGSGS